MSDFQTPPDPAGSPLEKLILQHRHSVPNEMARYLESEGLDPDTASRIATALSQREQDRDNVYQELLSELELWANIHTHGAGGAGAIPSIKNKSSIAEYGRTNAGNKKWDLPSEAEIGDKIFYVMIEEASVSAYSPSGQPTADFVVKGPIFTTYLSNDHRISVWEYSEVDEAIINEGGVYFTSTEGHIGTQLVLGGGGSISIGFAEEAYDGDLVYPLDTYTPFNENALLLTFVGQRLISSSKIWSIDDGADMFESPNDYWAMFQKLSDGTDYSPTITLDADDPDLGAAYLELTA